MPFDETPKIEWFIKVLEVAKKIIVNHLSNNGDQKLQNLYEDKKDKLHTFVNEQFLDPEKISSHLNIVLGQLAPDTSAKQTSMSWPTSLSDYNNMFHSDAFTDMTEIQYKAAVGAGFGLDTLTTAATNGRLFCCDYNMLSELIVDPETNTGGTYPGNSQKYIYMPQALFVLPPTASNSKPASLQPVAIRLKNDGPLFYPNDPNDTFAGKA